MTTPPTTPDRPADQLQAAADQLQAAAEKLRAAAANATEGAWAIWRDLDHQGYITVGDAAGVITPPALESSGECNPVAHVYVEEDAEHIALVHPGVGLALAAWLDVAAGHAREGFMCCDNGPDHCSEVVTPALAVARQLLGTSASAECGCDPAPHREDDGTYSHWAGCPIADEQQAADLTADEAREMVDDLNTELYQARDALAFVGECCDIADRNQRPITTGDVREWLRGARCGRQLLGTSTGEDTVADPEPDTVLRDRIAAVLWPLTDWNGEELNAVAAADAVVAELAHAAAPPAPADRAAVLRAEADRIDAMDEATSPRLAAGITWATSELRRLAGEAAAGAHQTEQADTLAPWLYQRFMNGGAGWDRLDEDDRSYWEHHARAVRRAVARGGFNGIDPSRLLGIEQPADGTGCTCGGRFPTFHLHADTHEPVTTTPAAPAAPEETTWVGATELASDREIARVAATGVVGYRQNQGRLHHCLAHKPAPASRWADFHEVGADDLDDGGICVYRDCGRDLLAAWPAVPEETR